jgi:hypothetical protein
MTSKSIARQSPFYYVQWQDINGMMFNGTKLSITRELLLRWGSGIKIKYISKILA